MASESYLIRIRQTGAREVRRSLDDVKQGARGANDALRSLRTGLNLLLGLYGLQALQQYADEYTNLVTKLDIATRSTWELVRAEKQLFDISRNTRVSFAATADLYGRLERSTRSLNISQDNLLQMTDTINKAMTLSGASTQAANAAILQLGQGMAAGVLRGDELNSVLEQAPRLAEAIATGMGVAVGDLKSLGEQGAISVTKVVNALASQADLIDEEFKSVALTIGQSFTVLDNQLLRTIGLLDKEFKISETIAQGILLIADNLDQVAGAAVGAAAGLAVLYSSSVLTGLATVTRLVKGLTLALLTNPLGALAVAAATLIGYLTVMGDEISWFGDEVLKVSDVASGAFMVISDALSPIAEMLSNEISASLDVANGYFQQLADWIGVQLPTAASLARSALNNIIDGFVLIYNAARIAINFFATGFSQLIDVVSKFGVFLVEGLGASFQTVQGIFGVVDQEVSNGFGGWLGLVETFANAVIGTFAGMWEAIKVFNARIYEGFKTTFADLGNLAAGAVAGIMEVFRGGDFNDIWSQVQTNSGEAWGSIADDAIAAFNDGFNSADIATTFKENVVEPIKAAGLFEGVGEDHIGDITEQFNTMYDNILVRANDVAATRLSLEKETTDEIKRQNQFLEDQAEGLGSSQLEDFTKRLNAMRETLNGLQPTWERSLEVIKAWKETQLNAVDETWERYDEYAAMVEEVTKEKIVAAFQEMTDSSTTAFGGLIQAAQEMQSEYDNVAAVMKKGMGNVIDQLTNSFTQFALTGRMSFRELASGLAASIAQMMVRMLVMRAVLAALNVIPGFASFMAGADAGAQASTAAGAASNFATSNAILQSGTAQAQSAAKPFAKGGAFQNGVEMFANGGAFTNGIVSRPTNFAMAGGLGLMGEAGAEAIMPLTRGKDGKLGVQASGSGGGSQQVNVYIVQSEEEAAERMAANPDAINVLRKAFDREE